MTTASQGGAPGARLRVVILGGGFAGLAAARRLAADPVDITLIDRSNHHLFQPLLYQVATAGLAATAIAAPIRHILAAQRNCTVLLGEAHAVDSAARRVTLADGRSFEYDYLLVATGATHSYFGHDPWSRFAPGLKTLEDAMLIRRRILLAFEYAEAADSAAERQAWLTFIVVGAGATGVELAGTLAEIARHTLRREFRHIDTRKARVILLEGAARVLLSYPEALSLQARHQLERLGVEVHTERRVEGIDADGVTVATPTGTERIASKCVLWAAGVAASPVGATLGAPRDRAGRVCVQPDLSLPGDPRTFVVGDLAMLAENGRPVPGVAPAAKQMGQCAAENIQRRMQGRDTVAFHYRDYGGLATIGRGSAILKAGRIEMSGWPAWLFWLFVHIFFLIGFRNRILVLGAWAWSYVTFQRGARIVIGSTALPEEGVQDRRRQTG